MNHSTEKGIAIGIIGPEVLVNRMMKVLQSFPSFRPIASIYKKEEEAAGLAAEIASEAEVILVSGPLPYHRIREETSLDVALHYVPLTDTSFYRSLSRLKNALEPEKQLRISMDTLGKTMVAKSLQEINESRVQTILYSGTAYPTIEALIGFHVQLFESGACDAAMTAEAAVSEALTERGIPNEWIIPTDQNITVALERALLSTETRQSKEAQIVVGLLNIDHFEKRIHTHTSEHEVQKFKLEIHRMLLDYVESLDGYLTHLGGDEYLFFTTRGIFERETGGYKTIPLGKHANQKFGLSLSIGIGFGRSANEAGTHARSALRKSKDAGGDTCFIVREDKTFIGPLAMADPIEITLSMTDAALIKKAEEAGMTSVYLSKMLAHVARSGRVDYMVHELAAILGITARSTHRLVLQWIDYGLVRIAGVEKVPKGRPRQIFKLSFLEDKVNH
ncbi:GGDEF domain-containing protein [Paenibacillus endophyticus]|uniref:GGDEF domain-containing protein n=1 Tax=Paenibacillus endophyticus TaxID=1294268 RepID=A0A7W5G9M2_9BACL|nr:hypothetical protein [Paenibacillus endophyticus]MBB3151840.1 GGDEF domain-containing protein [Paenibacillus endophyticus]